VNSCLIADSVADGATFLVGWICMFWVSGGFVCSGSLFYCMFWITFSLVRGRLSRAEVVVVEASRAALTSPPPSPPACPGA